MYRKGWLVTFFNQTWFADPLEPLIPCRGNKKTLSKAWKKSWFLAICQWFGSNGQWICSTLLRKRGVSLLKTDSHTQPEHCQEFLPFFLLTNTKTIEFRHSGHPPQWVKGRNMRECTANPSKFRAGNRQCVIKPSCIVKIRMRNEGVCTESIRAI